MSTKVSAADITIILNPGKSYSYDCIGEFSAMAEEYGLQIRYARGRYEKLLHLCWFLTRYLPLPKIGWGKSKTNNLTFNIGPDFTAALEFSPATPNNFMFAYDCWPRFNERIIKLTRMCRLKVLFFSARQAAELFNQHREGKTECIGIWIPEGIRAAEYHALPAKLKDIDVLEFGRRYEDFHKKIVLPLAEGGYSHQYAKEGAVLFPGKPDFIDGLSRSKISVCFTSDITHPERAEFISTMTLRYLQSMAAKCLVVGNIPSDIVAVFGYNPVVEIDMNKAGEQIIDILNNYDRYTDLIERNYNAVHQHHTWKQRLDAMAGYIAKYTG